MRRAIRRNSATRLTAFTPLRYTPIHEQYVAIAETELQAGLLEGMGGGFDIVEFLSKVPAWVESGEVTDDEASSETLEVLTSFTSFESFKELMLARKAEKEGGGGGGSRRRRSIFGQYSGTPEPNPTKPSSKTQARADESDELSPVGRLLDGDHVPLDLVSRWRKKLGFFFFTSDPRPSSFFRRGAPARPHYSFRKCAK